MCNVNNTVYQCIYFVILCPISYVQCQPLNARVKVQYSHISICYRDLAARNCLVKGTDPYTVKISDFGLSRLDGQCSLSDDNEIPVKWAAPEVLNDDEQCNIIKYVEIEKGVGRYRNMRFIYMYLTSHLSARKSFVISTWLVVDRLWFTRGQQIPYGEQSSVIAQYNNHV